MAGFVLVAGCIANDRSMEKEAGVLCAFCQGSFRLNLRLLQPAVCIQRPGQRVVGKKTSPRVSSSRWASLRAISGWLPRVAR